MMSFRRVWPTDDTRWLAAVNMDGCRVGREINCTSRIDAVVSRLFRTARDINNKQGKEHIAVLSVTYSLYNDQCFDRNNFPLLL